MMGSTGAAPARITRGPIALDAWLPHPSQMGKSADPTLLLERCQSMGGMDWAADRVAWVQACFLLLVTLLLAVPAAAQQQPNNACRMACRVGQGPPSPDQRQCLAQCMAGQPITRDAPGQARPAGSQAGSPSAAMRPQQPPPQQQPQPQPRPQQQARAQPNPPQQQRGRGAAPPPGSAQAASPAVPSPQPRPGALYGAFYIGIPPSMSYGIAVAQRDRSQAHRLAEIACRGRGGNCSLQTEFSEICVAVMEGVRRAPSAFFMTSDPRTYIVRAVTLGNASNPADAERSARDACMARERGALTCRIVHAECGAR